MKKRHYYNFAFYSSEGNRGVVASISIGYKHKFISMPEIQRAKEGARVDESAVMISCSYLGKMTESEVKTGVTTSHKWRTTAAFFW